MTSVWSSSCVHREQVSSLWCFVSRKNGSLMTKPCVCTAGNSSKVRHHRISMLAAPGYCEKKKSNYMKFKKRKKSWLTSSAFVCCRRTSTSTMRNCKVLKCLKKNNFVYFIKLVKPRLKKVWPKKQTNLNSFALLWPPPCKTLCLLGTPTPNLGTTSLCLTKLLSGSSYKVDQSMTHCLL